MHKQQHLFSSEQPPVRRDHPQTSRDAADSVAESAASMRGRLLTWLRCRGTAGATDEEMQVGLAMNPSTQRPRRGELVEKGLVVDSGETYPTTSGRRAIVWKAVQ